MTTSHASNFIEFACYGCGQMTVNTLNMATPNLSAFGVDVVGNSAGTWSNVTADWAGQGSSCGRPIKTTGQVYSTFTNTVVKNTTCAYENGISLEAYSQHNVFNGCTVTN